MELSSPLFKDSVSASDKNVAREGCAHLKKYIPQAGQAALVGKG